MPWRALQICRGGFYFFSTLSSASCAFFRCHSRVLAFVSQRGVYLTPASSAVSLHSPPPPPPFLSPSGRAKNVSSTCNIYDYHFLYVFDSLRVKRVGGGEGDVGNCRVSHRVALHFTCQLSLLLQLLLLPGCQLRQGYEAAASSEICVSSSYTL